jgi:hypothetical protein
MQRVLLMLLLAISFFWLARQEPREQEPTPARVAAGHQRIVCVPPEPISVPPEPISIPEHRSLPAWLTRYEKAGYTQRIAVTDGRDTITPVPIAGIESKWHQPGGMEGVQGWRSELYKYVAGGQAWVGDIAVWNGSNFQNNRGHKRLYGDGTVFVDALTYQGKPFEIRRRTKKNGRWESDVIFRDKAAYPPGYAGLKGQTCSSCHDEAGTGGYAVGLVPGGDGVLSDPFEGLER